MTQRRPTSFDIAALAGVSQPTVSRALSGSSSVSEPTRQRVLEAAERLNYKVDRNASALRRQQARTLALLFFEELPDGSEINPFYLSLLGPMVRRCADRGYDLLISFQQLSSDWHVDYEDSRKADGIILLGYGDYVQYRPRLEQLVARGTHFVRWGCSANGGDIGATVSCDNEQGGYEATRHLLERGKRRIAFVGTGGPGFPEVEERWRGYCRALHAAGIDPADQPRAEAAPSEAEGRAAVAEMLGRGADFDAIFAASDVAAIGALHALQHAGRSVPETSVVGFDDIPAASLASPPLTTITQDVRAAAEALIDTVIEAVELGAATDRVLPVRLTVRESS
ncbi:MAG TPA: LacI family DNA-binding transcriptional regulator [Sphingomicrobium sp.]|jgi:DNA-binding LacI/PurR family transcriptional regulator